MFERITYTVAKMNSWWNNNTENQNFLHAGEA
jgi:hypothetical protein